MVVNPSHGHSAEGPGQQLEETLAFPLTVDPFMGGWCVTVHLKNGQNWRLLKPGWVAEPNAPYVFHTPAEAWEFLRKIFQFCSRQQNPYNDKLLNCPNCGKVYRGRFLAACEDCTMTSDYLMQQIFQGFYFMSGSYDEVLMRMAMYLNISPQKLLNIKSAYNLMVNQAPRWRDDFENDNDPHSPAAKNKARPASTRRHQYGLRNK